MSRIEFPKGGLNDDTSRADQPPLTTADALNVRTIDPSTGRSRGGQRSGTTQFLTGQLNGSNPVQALEQTMRPVSHLSVASLGSTNVTASNAATGTVTLDDFSLVDIHTTVPGFTVGDRIAISDGVTSITFELTFNEEFTSDDAYVGFTYAGASAALTLLNLVLKINEQAFDIGAAVDLTTPTQANLINTNPDSGSAGNVTITVTQDNGTAWLVDGMSGGVTADTNTLQVEWSKEPQQASAVLYTLGDLNSNVWAVTDAGTAVQYNQDGRPVATIQPPIPALHTIVPRISVGADESVYLASYDSADEDSSRIWRYVREEDGYSRKWEITVAGRVREIQENVGALYVVTDMRTTDDQDVGGLFTGYAGLTQSTPFSFFSNECPMPTFAMALAPNGTIAMAHPFNVNRGMATNTKQMTARVATPDIWTPWDLDDYQSRLFAWYRAEDALDGSGAACDDGDEVATLPDHRQSPPTGYSDVLDTTDRLLAKNERQGPQFKASGLVGLMPSLDFDPTRYSGGSLAGEMLRGGGVSGGTAKTTTSTVLSQTSPIPSWDDSYYAICFAIRFNSLTDETPQRVLWSQHDAASGSSGSSYGFVTGSAGGDVSSGGLTAVERAVWFDAGSDAASAGTVIGGDHPTAGSSFLNYNDDAAQAGSKRMAIVSIVKGNLRGDGTSTSVVRVNGKQVDCFEFEYDKCDGDRFILGCRRQADAQGSGDLYTDSFGIFESWKGQFLEWVTVLGRSSDPSSPHDLPVTCPLGGSGAGGSSEDGYSASGSVPSHIAHLDPDNASEIERIEGYLAHKYGASSGLPLQYSPGVPRDTDGFYEAHPFGGPGFYPLGPNRTTDRPYWLNAWSNTCTLWTAGGDLVDAMVGSGVGVGVAFDPDGNCITGGPLQFRYTDTLDNEQDAGFRKALVIAGQFKQSVCARATINLSGVPPNAEAVTLSDNTNTVTFEFTTVAASGSNTKVDTDVTATDYATTTRLVALNFIAAVEASALNIEGWVSSAQQASTQVIEFIQGVAGTAKETDVTITSAGTITGDSAFDDAVNATGAWRARSADSLESLSVSNGDGVAIRTDADGNFYMPDRSYLSDNGIVRRKSTDGSVQWRYLFAGDEVARSVSLPPNPADYAGASVDGPEFIYGGIETGALGGESLYKLRVLEVAEDLTGSRSPREAVYLGVCGGSITTFTPAGSASVPTGGADLFSSDTPYIQTAVLRNKVFFTDGLKAYVYDAEDDAVTPFESQTVSSYPRRFKLMASWRNRLVVARTPGDETNWYMSRSGDAFDWDESPAIVDAQQPVSGNTGKGRVGESPDVINSLIPWSDDLLIIGGDRSIWRMTGDPMQGAQVDLVSDSTGIAYLTPWCKDPDGTLYFFGSRGGVWVMPPGGSPQRITKHTIERRMQALDLSQYKLELVWNYYDEGLHVFAIPYNLTEISQPVAWFFDAKHGAWWEDQWQSTGTAVRSTLLADGDRPDDRRVLLGCADGRVRYVDPSSTTDDGNRIDSRVLIGPLMPESAEHEARFTGLTAVLADTLGPLAYEILTGEDAESAEVVGRGNWEPGRNPISRERWTGPAAWVRLRSGSADSWAMESMHVDVYPTSRKRLK